MIDLIAYALAAVAVIDVVLCRGRIGDTCARYVGVQAIRERFKG